MIKWFYIPLYECKDLFKPGSLFTNDCAFLMLAKSYLNDCKLSFVRIPL